MSAAEAKNSDNGDEPSEKPTRSMVILLFATAADTTWRMFVPTFGGALLGLWIGTMVGMELIFTTGGLAVGIIVTALLVRLQYKQTDNNHE